MPHAPFVRDCIDSGECHIGLTPGSRTRDHILRVGVHRRPLRRFNLALHGGNQRREERVDVGVGGAAGLADLDRGRMSFWPMVLIEA
jgi:hypothetical protein